MALDEPRKIPEKPKYKAWYHDPEQVENLLLMLEEKAAHPQTQERQNKFSVGYAYRKLFPSQEKMPWTSPYKHAPIPPTENSFVATVSQLASEKTAFGEKIPGQLVKRFHIAMSDRKSHQALEGSSRWDRPQKIVVAGLVEYCAISGENVVRLLENIPALRIATPATVNSRIFRWKQKKEFPYEHRDSLRQNNPMVIEFVDTLYALTGMTLKDIHAWVEKNKGHSHKDRIQALESFIARYEIYRKRLFKSDSADK